MMYLSYHKFSKPIISSFGIVGVINNNPGYFFGGNSRGQARYKTSTDQRSRTAGGLLTSAKLGGSIQNDCLVETLF
jgi:hypothetical protein